MSGCLGEEVGRLDFTDDRLGTVLDLLGQDKEWVQFETALNQRTIRVYNLKPERVRIDPTSVNGYWQVSEDGLFQVGHSKDHRPDLPQVKVVLATVDPLGLPVVTQVWQDTKPMTGCTFRRLTRCGPGWGRVGCCMWVTAS